jgi:transposase
MPTLWTNSYFVSTVGGAPLSVILDFATLSTGDTIENPRYYRKAEKKLEHLQQSRVRKKRGSTRRTKAVKQVAKAHKK